MIDGGEARKSDESQKTSKKPKARSDDGLLRAWRMLG
jgi:hypothetical protein